MTLFLLWLQSFFSQKRKQEPSFREKFSERQKKRKRKKNKLKLGALCYPSSHSGSFTLITPTRERECWWRQLLKLPQLELEVNTQMFFWGLNLDGHDRFSDFIIHPKFQFPKHLKYKIQFCGIFHFLTLLTPKTPTCEHKCHFLK